jgi:hypothetical protein
MFKNIFGLLLVIVVSYANAGNGEFFQYDYSLDAQSIVMAKGVNDWQVSGAYSQWNASGKSFSGGLTKTVFNGEAIGMTNKFSVGLGGVSHHSDPDAVSPSASAIGLKLSAESFNQLNYGSVYALVEVNSAFKTWLGVVQINPANSNLGVEWSSVGDDRWYIGHRLAMRWKINATPWSIRAGRQTDSANYFIGLSYNTF